MSPEERQEEWSRSNITQRWSKIDERVANGLYDLWLLYLEYPEDHRKKVFDDRAHPPDESGGYSELYFPLMMSPLGPVNYLTESIGFILLGVLENWDTPLDDEDFYETVFQRTIERVLGKVSLGAENLDVDVTIEGWVRSGDVPRGEQLSEHSPSILRSLLHAGEISDEEFARAILEQKESDDAADEE